DMAVHLSVLLLLTGLTGIHGITTVSEVSVKAGGSISIPCLYDSRYKNNVKYLCEGYYWNYCSYAVKTNSASSGKFSIADDKIQRIFTVMIKDLKEWDRGDYWCVVEINKGTDNGKYFHLSVTRGTPSLYVDHQEITASIEDKITIKCHHSNRGVIKWCRLGSSCVTEPSGSIDGTAVTINRSAPNVFTVAMSELSTESSGWYLCVQGELQMPVHLTVTEKPTTGDDQVDLKSIIIIPLSLLILALMVTLFVWFMLKRHSKSTLIFDESNSYIFYLCNCLLFINIYTLNLTTVHLCD
uniref:Immunoglobulin domain-containing protein n=1 Tax=Sparus aurata TaxID=8175 RepID=A0A671X100_SPAAU